MTIAVDLGHKATKQQQQQQQQQQPYVIVIHATREHKK